MNNKEKLKLFWKITKHINKKFCNNQLEISRIIHFKKGDLDKSFPNKDGWYFNEKKSILIKKDEALVMQLIILAHELAHAYQHQILKHKRLRHGKKGEKVYQKFLKETDKFMSNLFYHPF